MSVYSTPGRRKLTVIAQDPAVATEDGKVLMTRIEVPAERLAPGPRGHRVHVVDFDSSSNAFYGPCETNLDEDRFAGVDDRARLESDPHFHAQNVYAIVSSTLLAFESALGRHVSWGFANGSHQIKVAPHAFAEANAFYSRRDEGLLFGYFPALFDARMVFTCLSHDIVAHEATHALLDGLRRQYARPSSPDQAAFHEAYADIVALLLVLRSKELVAHGLAPVRRRQDGTFKLGDVETAITDRSFLTGLGEQMGAELGGLNRDALRRSVKLAPSPDYLGQDEYQEAHARGEILVAAVMQAFWQMWWRRLLGKIELGGRGAAKLGPEDAGRRVETWRVFEEGATTAAHLLKIVIRALDYMPPVDIDFGDFLSAVVTADSEACPDDSKYGYRGILRNCFADFGMKPSSGTRAEPGRWQVPEGDFVYGHSHAEPMRWDREAVFRFIWENRGPLRLVEDASTTVESVRPVVRVAPDGFVLNEVVVEYFQLLDIRAEELKDIGLRRPRGMPARQNVRLYGGGTLVFDEFGHLKFDIANRLDSKRQNGRLEELWKRGAFTREVRAERRFARLHRERAMRQSTFAEERW